MPRAVGLADELLSGWSPIIRTLDLVPADKGRFELTIDGELVFSKAELGRHAEPGEIVAIARRVMGDEIPRD